MLSKLKHIAGGASKLGYAALNMDATDLSRERVAVCNSCEQLTRLRQCGVCHCFVDQKAKYLDETCPIVVVRRTDHVSEKVDVLEVQDKWQTIFTLQVPSDFARSHDVLIMPTSTEVINTRTKQRASCTKESTANEIE